MNTFTAYHLSKFIPCVSTAAHPQQKRVKYQAANLHELQAIKNKFIPCMIPRRRIRKKKKEVPKASNTYYLMDPDTDVCQTEQPQISYSVDALKCGK